MSEMNLEDAMMFVEKPTDPYSLDLKAVRTVILDLVRRVGSLEKIINEKVTKGKKK